MSKLADLLFVKSCRVENLETRLVYTIIYSTLINPEIDVIEVIPRALFQSNGSYGWLSRKGGTFLSTTDEEEAQISAFSESKTRLHTGYLHLSLEEGRLTRFSLLVGKQEFEPRALQEQPIAELLFSLLRTNKYDTLLVAGVDEPAKYLKTLYGKYWHNRYTSCIDVPEILGLEAFLRCYPAIPPSSSWTGVDPVQTAWDIKEIDESQDVCPKLKRLANSLGIPRHSLLDLPSESLLRYFGLKGSDRKEHKTILLRNVFKNSTRLALLSALAHGLQRQLLLEPNSARTAMGLDQYSIYSALSQEALFEIVQAADSHTQDWYRNLLSELDNSYQLNSFVYSQTSTSEFQPLEEIVCLVDIPVNRRASVSSKSDSKMGSRYVLELTKTGTLNSNVPLTSTQIHELKSLLPKLTQDLIPEVYLILKRTKKY